MKYEGFMESDRNRFRFNTATFEVTKEHFLKYVLKDRFPDDIAEAVYHYYAHRSLEASECRMEYDTLPVEDDLLHWQFVPSFEELYAMFGGKLPFEAWCIIRGYDPHNLSDDEKQEYTDAFTRELNNGAVSVKSGGWVYLDSIEPCPIKQHVDLTMKKIECTVNGGLAILGDSEGMPKMLSLPCEEQDITLTYYLANSQIDDLVDCEALKGWSKSQRFQHFARILDDNQVFLELTADKIIVCKYPKEEYWSDTNSIVIQLIDEKHMQ